jgi:hypothetical protein
MGGRFHRLGQAVDLPSDAADVLGLHEQVAQPQGQAVHQHDVRRRAVGGDGSGQVHGDFQGVPGRVALLPVPVDPILHLVVTGHTGGHEHPAVAHAFGQAAGHGCFCRCGSRPGPEFYRCHVTLVSLSTDVVSKNILLDEMSKSK